MRVILVSFFALWLGISPASAEDWKLFHRWLVVMNPSTNPAEQVGRFFVGGLQVEEDRFLVAGLAPQVAARSIRTGQVLWESPLKGPSQSSWVVEGDEVFGADTKGYAYALNRRTGESLWERRVRGIFFGEALVDRERFYLMNSQGQLVALDRHTGEWLWQQSDTEASLFSLISGQPLAFFQNRLLAGFPSGRLQGLQASTGERLWTDSFGTAGVDSMGLNDLRSIRSEGEYLVAASFGGILRAWKAQAGSRKLLWEKSVGVHSSPVIDQASGSVFVSDREGRVQKIELETGNLIWEYSLARGLASEVALGSEEVWFGSSEGSLFVLDRRTGKPLLSSTELGSGIFHAPVIVAEKEVLVVTSRGILRRVFLQKI
ncbi:MAG: hypothetical protein EA369_06885 [Bradymonadales bacterium]|nr:MAG: hypothetical protein EA369_06885 [Bradymonadales bacterium]